MLWKRCKHGLGFLNVRKREFINEFNGSPSYDLPDYCLKKGVHLIPVLELLIKGAFYVLREEEPPSIIAFFYSILTQNLSVPLNEDPIEFALSPEYTVTFRRKSKDTSNENYSHIKASRF